jgi:hypothetical protein
MLVNMGDKGAQSVQHPFVSRDKATLHLALVKRGVGEETIKKAGYVLTKRTRPFSGFRKGPGPDLKTFLT